MKNGYDGLEEEFKEWVKKIKPHYEFAVSTEEDDSQQPLSEAYFSYIRRGYDSFTEYLPLRTRKRLDKILSQEGISLKRIGIKPISMFQSLLIFLRLE